MDILHLTYVNNSIKKTILLARAGKNLNIVIRQKYQIGITSSTLHTDFTTIHKYLFEYK